jgi:hypothetical protein
MLAPNGCLCVADLVQEDGSFHGEGFHGHNGFSRDGFERLLGTAGLGIEHWDTCFTIDRQSGDGERRSFSVFLATAKRSA